MAEKESPKLVTERTDFIKGKNLDPGRPYYDMPIPLGKIDPPTSADPGVAKE